MLTLPKQTWVKYVNRLSAIDKAAGDKMRQLFEMGGFPQDYKASKQILDYANSLVMVYGEASAALAAEMYDAISALENVTVPSAVPAEVPSYGEVAKAVNGTMKSGNIEIVAGAIERLVKLPSADTMLQNAKRDGAEWAWIPNGDTCVFCLTLASRGWQPASKAVLQGGHAEHIHAHCDCTFAIRHDSNTNVRGYDPEKYREMYDNADGRSSKDKINALRREKYAENKDAINAQKRAAYVNRKALHNENIGDNIKQMDKAEEIQIFRSLSARAKNYDVELPSGEYVHFTEGTRITDIKVIAGKGKERAIDEVDILVDRYGGDASEWQKKKGIGYVDYENESYKAEVHWYEEPSIGRVKFKTKAHNGEWIIEE